MCQVTRLIGGAGTGKTHAILTAMTDAREELGLRPEEIGFSTFTRNGRQVMARRAAEAWGIDESRLTRDGHFRTTHSTALRLTGISREQLLTDDRASIEWIAERLGTSLGGDGEDDESETSQPLGRESQMAVLAINAWQLSRNRLVPYAAVLDEALAQGVSVPELESARAMVEKYEAAKRADDRLDYADLLGRFVGISFHVDGHLEIAPQGDVPEELRMLCLDEAQDASALIDLTCRRLANGPNVERVLIVGDNFQSIFGFNGGSAEHFMSWKASQSVMPMSFRCPRPIMDFGEDCLRQMHEGYWDRGIQPASHDGSIEQTGCAQDAIATFVDPAKTALVLARCSFTLPRYEKLLDERAIPFSRLNCPDAAARRGCLALWNLEHDLTVQQEDFAEAVEMLPVKNAEVGNLLDKGAKAAWSRGDFTSYDLIRRSDLTQLGCTPAAVAMILRGEWPEAMTPKHRRLARRWVDSAKEYGPDLATSPRVKLSTIHAAKGAEADLVILSTESSRKVHLNSSRLPQLHDEECRVAYVAVTRARERLVIVEDSGPYRLALPRGF
jgi:DNA helicase-2/ATP-dependent DNA helicase PcrA